MTSLRDYVATARVKQKERLAICATCDQLVDARRCSACGCFVKTKALLPNETCPLGKW